MNGVQLLLVVLVAICVSAVAHRRGVAAPLLVVVVGMLASFIPGLPRLELEPEVILSIVLPPLLYSTALDFSFVSFARNLGPILRLGVGLVLVTAFVVGGVGSAVVPALSFGAALVLGAVVSPPDAVTAVAIGRTLGMPKRVMTILTGESLVNDAAALTLFTVGVASVAGTHAFVDNPILFFVYASVVGIVVGLVVGWICQFLRSRLDDPGLETVLGLSVPFVAYLAAEEIHASGVLAVVLAGFSVGHNSAHNGYATRLQERQVWRSLDMLLETFVFAYMGLQLRFVIDDMRSEGEDLGALFTSSLIVLLVVMLIRPLWVFTVYGGGRLRRRAGLVRTGSESAVPTWRHSSLISWTGMRGVVTLAAAGGVPVTIASGAPFPGRASIQFIALIVAIGTLLLQGATLPWVVRTLAIPTDGEKQVSQLERRKAKKISRRASKQAVTELIHDPPAGVDTKLLAGMADRLRQAQETRASYPTDQNGMLRADVALTVNTLRRQMLSAQRAALIKERDAGTLDDEVVRELLEELDLEEAATSAWASSRLQ